MITLNLTHLLILLIFAQAGGLYYFWQKFKKNIATLEKQHQESIKTIEVQHDIELNDIQNQINEIEKLAQEKIEKTEVAYVDAIKSLNAENEFYQKYMIDVNTAITLADNKLKEIDVAGTFAADDEIGWFFKTLKDVQKILNEFKTEIQDRKF